MPPRPAAPAPRPVAPPKLEQTVAAPTPQPVRVAPAPANTAPGSSPRVSAREVATIQAVAPRPQVEAEADPEEAEEYVSPTPARRPTRNRTSAAKDLSKKGKLTLLLGIAGGIVFVVGAFLVYFLAFTKPTTSVDPKAQRHTFRVLGNSPGALHMAIRQAKDGDLILLEGDVKEANVRVTVPNLTIEADAGRAVTWIYPATGPHDYNLLHVENVPGFRLRGITLDGGNKAKALISLYGKCPGTHLEKLQLKNAKVNGVIFANCEGTADSRVRLTDVTITTSKPTESAIRFEINPSMQSAPQVNRYFDLRQVSFPGGGRKATTPNPEFVLPTTIELPSGVSLETVP